MARRQQADRQKLIRSKIASSPELLLAARQLATLAIAQQDKPLNPRQREELRRGLTLAGEQLGWSELLATNADAGVELAFDVLTLAGAGIESLRKELAEERTNKQKEIARLTQVVAQVRKMAANPRTSYPAEITYSHTVRDSYQRLVTKTAKNTVNNAQEALAAADALEKSIEGRGKLAELMVIDLDEHRGRLQALTSTLPDFAKSSRGILDEVIASLS